jgi:hypothetical protein
MRISTRIVAASLGILAGLGSIEHGVFEILQGNIATSGLFFSAIGYPCEPGSSWNACEPAISIFQNMLIIGILTIMGSLLTVTWSIVFLHRKWGGVGLILLSIAQLLCGGGFYPPVIGIIGGLLGLQITRPLKRKTDKVTYSLAKLWPWPLIVLIGWVVIQFPLGIYNNGLMISLMRINLILVLGSLALSIISAYAQDAIRSGS